MLKPMKSSSMDNSLIDCRSAAEVVVVEGVELHFIVVLAGMQAVEIGAAVEAQQHCLAVDHEGSVPVSKRGPQRSAETDRSSRDRCA